MPKITIDGKEIACRESIPVLQAALEAGWDIPHYCYHPGLTVVASCRLCLMEMKLPHPKTQEMDWAPKLFPSCQTPVRDGMEVRLDSDKVRDSQRDCLELYLIDHPLDCPVCDKAGECYLQDYSYRFGNATSRMVDAKHVNPKKDIGPHTLLYQDRCVLCGRCVRFADEVAGTGELAVVNRGDRSEIDVFPGQPLDNKLQGNVVDLCPVGALLDKDFLFAQRVWFLSDAKSVCPGCSTGCTISVDHNHGQVYRIRPRTNPEVNDWWICDEGRFGWKYVHDAARIGAPVVRRAGHAAPVRWEELPGLLTYRFEQAAAGDDGACVAAVLSPMMSCEEAWLLARFIRRVAPASTLALGPVPTDGDDERFPLHATNGEVKFTIRAEKCPNRRGVQTILDHAGGATASFDDLQARCESGEVKAVWLVGGYPREWVTKDMVKQLAGLDLLVVQDLLASPLVEAADVVLPSCSFAEREGSFMNHAGLLQPFAPALTPPDGTQADGQYLYALAGFEGLYRGTRVREKMAEQMPAFAEVYEPPAPPEHAH